MTAKKKNKTLWPQLKGKNKIKNSSSTHKIGKQIEAHKIPINQT
jgi:hypothetical protein